MDSGCGRGQCLDKMAFQDQKMFRVTSSVNFESFLIHDNKLRITE